jgi:hypothetical protein
MGVRDMGIHLAAQSRSSRAPALSESFAHTLSAVASFMNALLNEIERSHAVSLRIGKGTASLLLGLVDDLSRVANLH